MAAALVPCPGPCGGVAGWSSAFWKVCPICAGAGVWPKPSDACAGACGGVPGYRAASGLYCPTCMGSGKYKAPPTAAEEWAGVAGSRAKRRARAQLASKSRPSRAPSRPRAKRRDFKGANLRARDEARRLDGERLAFFKTKAPSGALLDQLRKEQTWLPNKTNPKP